MKLNNNTGSRAAHPTHHSSTRSSNPLQFILLAIATFICMGSFAQDNPLFRNIPPTANAVYQVNIPAITAKLSWSEIMGNIPPAKLMTPRDESFMNMLKDPAKSGIDIGKDIFMAEDKSDPWDSISTTTIILHLQDSGRFIAYMRTQEPGLRIYPIPNKGKVRTAGKEKMGLAWNKELAVLVFVKPSGREEFDKQKHYQGGNIDPNGAIVPPAGKPRPAMQAPNYTLIAVRRGLLAINGFDNSFYSTDPTFKAGFSDDADIHIWTEKGKGLSFLLNTLLKSRAPLQSLLQGGGGTLAGASASGSKTLTSIRFEAGSVIMKSSNILTPEAASFAAKMSSRPLNTDLVAGIPKGSLLGLINLHFDPTVIDDMLDKAGIRSKIDSMLATKNLRLDTILHAFKGDFQLAVMEPEMSDSSQKPKVPFYVAITINDLSSFAKITSFIRAVKDSAGVDSSTGASRSPFGKMKIASTLQGNLLVVSSTKEYTDGWFSNTEKRNTGFLTDRMKGGAVTVLVDFRTLAHFVEGMSKGKDPSGKDKKVLDLIHMLDRLTITGGAVKDGKAETVVELQLTDPSANSLVQLFRILHM